MMTNWVLVVLEGKRLSLRSIYLELLSYSCGTAECKIQIFIVISSRCVMPELSFVPQLLAGADPSDPHRSNETALAGGASARLLIMRKVFVWRIWEHCDDLGEAVIWQHPGCDVAEHLAYESRHTADDIKTSYLRSVSVVVESACLLFNVLPDQGAVFALKGHPQPLPAQSLRWRDACRRLVRCQDWQAIIT